MCKNILLALTNVNHPGDKINYVGHQTSYLSSVWLVAVAYISFLPYQPSLSKFEEKERERV